MNPITAARVSAGLSKQQFSKNLRLSRTFILRAEEGCYSNPGSTLVNFSTNELGISKSEFMRQYTRFQKFTRKRAIDNLPNIELLSIENLAPCRALENPNPPDDLEVNLIEIESKDIDKLYLHRVFKKWRESYWSTYVGFAKALCVHPASVENYENGAYKFMPELMIDALDEVNLFDSSFNPRLEFVFVERV
jgi:hypothetical protein